jgi:hypothetical protein
MDKLKQQSKTKPRPAIGRIRFKRYYVEKEREQIADKIHVEVNKQRHKLSGQRK